MHAYLRCLCKLAKSVRDRPHCPQGYFLWLPEWVDESDGDKLPLEPSPRDKCPRRKLPPDKVSKLLLLLLLLLLWLGEIELLLIILSLLLQLLRCSWRSWWLRCFWLMRLRCSVEEECDLLRRLSLSSSSSSSSVVLFLSWSISSLSLRLLLLFPARSAILERLNVPV